MQFRYYLCIQSVYIAWGYKTTRHLVFKCGVSFFWPCITAACAWQTDVGTHTKKQGLGMLEFPRKSVIQLLPFLFAGCAETSLTLNTLQRGGRNQEGKGERERKEKTHSSTLQTTKKDCAKMTEEQPSGSRHRSPSHACQWGGKPHPRNGVSIDVLYLCATIPSPRACFHGDQFIGVI